MKEIIDVVGLYYVLSFLVAWFSSNLIKAVIRSIKFKKGFKLKYGFENGGMPSTHSAVMSSIVVAVGYVDIISMGSFSKVFYVALIFALIVMSDAFGVRQYVGKQGVALNTVLKKNHEGLLDVVYGHTFCQVVVGALWGIFVSIVMYGLFF